MSVYPHPVIAREGWPFLIVAFVIALALSLASWWALAALAWLAFLFILQFFRDPPRHVPTQPNAVLSPADGRVVRVGNARDPYLDRDALVISVFMNVCPLLKSLPARGKFRSRASSIKAGISVVMCGAPLA